MNEQATLGAIEVPDRDSAVSFRLNDLVVVLELGSDSVYTEAKQAAGDEPLDRRR